MIARDAFLAPLWPPQRIASPLLFKTAERAAAIAAMGLLVVAAAMPSDRDGVWVLRAESC